MHASTLEAVDHQADVLTNDEFELGQPKREKFRQSLGKVYRARAAERRGGRSRSGHGRRRSKRWSW